MGPPSNEAGCMVDLAWSPAVEKHAHGSRDLVELHQLEENPAVAIQGQGAIR